MALVQSSISISLQYITTLMQQQQPQPHPFFTPQTISKLQQPTLAFIAQSVSFIQNYLTPSNTSGLYISFNGGKDATVVLFLTLLAMQKTKSQYKLKFIYFREPNPFQQVDTFITHIKTVLLPQHKFQFEWYQLSSKDYQKQLQNFSKSHILQYILMGSRKDDPHCSTLGLTAKSDKDKGYPQFTRLNPIINWSYEQVWQFIRQFNIPYCSLYDHGYTYLGNKDNTKKNESLYNHEANCYKPAHQGHSAIEQHSREKKDKHQIESPKKQ